MSSANAIAQNNEGSLLEIGIFHAISLFTAEKKRFIRICLFLFIALCPIDDFILQDTPLRSLGMSLSIFPLCALAFIEGAQWLLAEKPKISPVARFWIVYIIVISIYGLAFFGFSSHGENLLWKGTTSLISLLALVFAASMNYESSVVRTAVFVAFGLALVGFMFGNSNPFGLPVLTENGLLHFTPLVDQRPRGLTSEPAMLSITVIIIGMLSVHLAQSRRWKLLLFLVTLGLLIGCGSKGGILTLFACAIVLSIIKWHSKWYQVVVELFALFPLGVVLIWLIPNLFPEESFAVSGTIPTRVSMILCALTTVLHHPFGVGTPGFLPAVAKYLPGAMSTLESIFPFPLYFGEVSEYLISADMVSTKTFFFDQLMRFGIPFAVVFVVFIIKLLKMLGRTRRTALFIAILATTIAITTYIPGTGNFAVPILFGVALSEVRNGSNSLRCE